MTHIEQRAREISRYTAAAKAALDAANDIFDITKSDDVLGLNSRLHILIKRASENVDKAFEVVCGSRDVSS